MHANKKGGGGIQCQPFNPPRIASMDNPASLASRVTTLWKARPHRISDWLVDLSLL